MHVILMKNATIDNGSCEYAEQNYDCAGDCIVDIDCAGECGGFFNIR